MTRPSPAPSNAGSGPPAPLLSGQDAGPRPEAPAAVERFVELFASHLARGSLDKLVLAKPRGAGDGLQRIVARPVALRGGRALSATLRHATRDMVRNIPEAEAAEWLREALLGASAFGHAHLFAADEEAQLLTSRKGSATLRRAPRAQAARREPGGAGAADMGKAAGSGPGADADDEAGFGAAAEAGEESGCGPAASASTGLGGDAPSPLPTAAAAPAHDRAKRRHVDVAAPFLTALGVTDASHRLIPAMARKWKQIDKFVEIFEHALAASPLRGARALRVADFGAGKGYLTFAVHDHLCRAGVAPEVTGVEWRDDLVRLCNDAAARLGLEGLRFIQGDVRSHPLGAIDVMIALHACDTATDHAIHRGVRAGAAVILTSPCCHKELRPQLLSPAPLAPLLRHGIHLGQQAEMVTDGLRALLLEAEGYDTQVFEFVSLEHTSKNKMILAVRRGGKDDPAARRERIRAQVGELMRFYGVKRQALEGLLRQEDEAAGPAAPSSHLTV